MAEINQMKGGGERVCKTFIHRFDSGPRLHPNPTNQSTSSEPVAQSLSIDSDRYLGRIAGAPDRNRTGARA